MPGQRYADIAHRRRAMFARAQICNLLMHAMFDKPSNAPGARLSRSTREAPNAVQRTS